MSSKLITLAGQHEMAVLQARFRSIVSGVSASEIALMEQSLIDSKRLTTDQITLMVRAYARPSVCHATPDCDAQCCMVTS